MVALLTFLFALNGAPEPAPSSVVRLEGRTLHDASGPFLGLGATYMQALRHCKYDRPRLNKELQFLSECGFNYVRVLSMVDWPGLEIAPAWPDYDDQLRALVDLAHSHGMRTQLTLFADAQRVMPEQDMRLAHVRRVLEALKDREEKILLYEIANEGWQNGFPGDEGVDMLRELAGEVARRSPVLLALTSPPDMNALARLYAGSAATVATVHFSRDLRTEAGPWLPVIDCWNISQDKGLPPISSNEPIGPGASVASEDDPEKIFAAAAFAYLAGLPMYVFHSAAGVRAEYSFDTMAWLRQMKSLLALLPRDLPNWERFDANDEGNPLRPMDQTLNPLYNCGVRKGEQFLVLALALDATGREFRAGANLSFSIYSLSNEPLGEAISLAKDEVFSLKPHTRAAVAVIKGNLNELVRPPLNKAQ